ncbi:hypothetical protein [Escherichia coli]|uniref:hypothetical protein n=1 Tax=Escherichia coli TaxID=562 RepID=UPI003338074A
MTKDHAQGVFIRFIDFRGELLLRASAIDGVVPSEKNAATYVYLNGTRLTVELPYQIIREIIREGANKRGNSSRLTQSFHFFMFEPIFSPVNALNQPI